VFGTAPSPSHFSIPLGFAYLNFSGWGVSLMSGWFTLAFMVLPVVITASEEALKAVPKGFRDGSLALGATRWETIRTNVLPYAMPGILTSSILGIARVAGETAPIMFTAAYVVRDRLPWEVDKAVDVLFQGVMALPYHIYVVSSKIPQNAYTERVQFGTAFVFLGLVLMIALSSVILRSRMRARYRW
jgi:phosphate transport system permease protein